MFPPPPPQNLPWFSVFCEWHHQLNQVWKSETHLFPLSNPSPSTADFPNLSSGYLISTSIPTALDVASCCLSHYLKWRSSCAISLSASSPHYSQNDRSFQNASGIPPTWNPLTALRIKFKPLNVTYKDLQSLGLLPHFIPHSPLLYIPGIMTF